MKRIFSLIAVALLFTSNCFALDSQAVVPNFSLKSFQGNEVKLSDYSDKIVVLEWTNPGCPYVKKHYKNGDMQGLQKKYRDKGVVWLSINSTNTEHKNFLDGNKAKEIASKWSIDPKYMLADSDGKVGKIYGAKTTPHMFVINKGRLAYQGAIDDNSDYSSNPKDDKNYVANALNELLSDKQVSLAQTKQYGCGVKY